MVLATRVGVARCEREDPEPERHRVAEAAPYRRPRSTRRAGNAATVSRPPRAIAAASRQERADAHSADQEGQRRRARDERPRPDIVAGPAEDAGEHDQIAAPRPLRRVRKAGGERDRDAAGRDQHAGGLARAQPFDAEQRRNHHGDAAPASRRPSSRAPQSCTRRRNCRAPDRRRSTRRRAAPRRSSRVPLARAGATRSTIGSSTRNAAAEAQRAERQRIDIGDDEARRRRDRPPRVEESSAASTPMRSLMRERVPRRARQDNYAGDNNVLHATRPCAQQRRARGIGRKEALDADFLQGHVLRRAERRDGGEDAQRRVALAEMNAAAPACGFRAARRARAAARPDRRVRRRSSAAVSSVPSAIASACTLRRKCTATSSQFSMKGRSTSGATSASARLTGAGRRGTEQEGDQVPGPGIGALQVPAPVDHEGRIRLLLRQHVVERAADLRQFRIAEIALAPHRRKAGREHQGVLLAQRHIEHGAKAQHHLAARLGPAGLEEAQVPLRDLGGTAERKLRQAAMRAPPFQPWAESLRYLRGH